MKQIQTNYIVPAIFAGVLLTVSEYKNATTPVTPYVDTTNPPAIIQEAVFCEEGTAKQLEEYEPYIYMDDCFMEEYEIPLEYTMEEYAISIEDISDCYWQEWKE
ncbi:MAG: hypothetical protein HFG39_14240 [Lachnospiraceae bacterium]|nr:hypothetical protein [Lachnospiraceae bacterium]